MQQVTTVSTMTLDGGAPCFDFINSGFDLEMDVITERLHSYDDLLILTERLQLIDGNELQRLQKLAQNNRHEAAVALQNTIKIRMLMYKFFSRLAQGHLKDLGPGLLDEMNALFAEALPYRALVATQSNLHFAFQTEAAGLMTPAWLFVLSAYDLLQNERLNFVKQCQRCSWLFLDQTKNHRKKWCSMESCGNREKTKKYYANKKQLQ